jgi:DNA-binding IscR family transcriptional regulator
MAVHVLAVLAYEQGDRVTSASLAGSINTNPVIVRRLLLSLKKAKLVDTSKGAGSGSRLSRSPHRINMAEIYRSVEDSEPFATPVRKPNKACPVGRSILDALGIYFVSAQRAMEADLEKTSLADVISTLKASGSRIKKRVS